MFGRLRVAPVVQAFLRAHPALQIELLLADRIVDLVEEGRVHGNLDRTYALDDIAAAHADMEANRATGKVVGIP